MEEVWIGMTGDEKKQKIVDYIGTQILGVISTVNAEGHPESALVAVTETPELELIFGTYHTVRKYKNIQNNQHVSVVLGHDVDERITIQFEGVAREVTGNEAEQSKQLHIAKNPRSVKYAEKPEQRWFKIKPTWVRYVDLNSDPQEEFELTFRN